MILKRVRNVFAAGGLSGLVAAVVRRLRMPHAKSLPALRALLRGRVGLEIGGPSPIFAPGGLLALYREAQRVDNCNFAARTIWEGEIEAAAEFRAGREPGRQIIAEGGDLRAIASGAYEFVLSSHMLEHTANPLRVLAEWRRVLAPGGLLVLLLPHRDGTFDHRRPVTTLAHLRDDRDRGTGEEDATHLEEVLALHDLARDPGVTDAAAFRARVLDNAQVRSVHHHVFDLRLALAVVREAGFVPVLAEAFEPYHALVVAVAPGAATQAHAAVAVPLSAEAERAAFARSPFATDRA
jgi:SAM-dependent methyltransferase